MAAKLAVFGNPIAHSLSPQIHGQFADQAGLEVVYNKVQVESADFAETAGKFFSDGGKGLNITVPHKYLAYQFADSVSEQAQAAQAVNTLFLNENGEKRGENTDGYGLLKDIEQNLQWSVAGKRVLLLGAGGAAQGVISSLLERTPDQLIIANRTFSKAEELVERFSNSVFEACDMENLSELETFDLIISASSGGLSEDADEQYLPMTLRGDHTCCYDMIYGKQTPFLKWAGDVHKSDGLGMLIEQAARSFYLWFGVEVKTSPVLKTMREMINTQG